MTVERRKKKPVDVDLLELSAVEVEGPQRHKYGHRLIVQQPGRKARTVYLPQEEAAAIKAAVGAAKSALAGVPLDDDGEHVTPGAGNYRAAIARKASLLLQHPGQDAIQLDLHALCRAAKADKELEGLDELHRKFAQAKEQLERLRTESRAVAEENIRLKTLLKGQHGPDSDPGRGKGRRAAGRARPSEPAS